MHHADDAQPGEQENQRVAERQGVVDGPEQHDDQGQRKKQPAARRDNENAPLPQTQGRGAVALPAKQLLLQGGDDAHGLIREWRRCAAGC
jgi:hypothetical protein